MTLEGAHPAHLTSLIHVLRRAGVQIDVGDGIMKVGASGRLKAVDRVVTSPYPAFPTDLQAQVMTLLALSDGVSVMKETIFEGRFKHVDELCRMGADIRVDLNHAFIRGVPQLYGTSVEATDLRAGAALVIAGLAAHGRTVVEQVHHIDRGYDRIEAMFSKLNGDIVRVTNESLKLQVKGNASPPSRPSPAAGTFFVSDWTSPLADRHMVAFWRMEGN
ncbi:hypothetical protein [Cohnella faecalis]|uniref:hypothetical protein n=1 Tax=Cohnella faecalis TaxID=2315694 RepID=UPI001F280446|nr:hypothetical protein [Cohnella faecalis]